MAFLTGRFRHILLFNYAVAPEVLTPYLPPYTELDFYNGCCFLSLVGVQLADLKLYGVPLPLYRNYAQINLRFYVRRRLEKGVSRHGVVFLKQVVPHRLIGWGARRIFNERVVSHRVDCTIRENGQQSIGAEYRWHVQQQRHYIKAAFREEPYFSASVAERIFFVERHWGYSTQKDGICLEYRLDHPPWPAYRAMDGCSAVSVADFYGPPFTAILATRPHSVFACRGSTIFLSKGLRVRPGIFNPLAAIPKQPDVAPSPLLHESALTACNRPASSSRTDRRNLLPSDSREYFPH